MSEKTFGFIGCGNMGGALATAACKSGVGRVLLANRTQAKAEALAARLEGMGAAIFLNAVFPMASTGGIIGGIVILGVAVMYLYSYLLYKKRHPGGEK